MAYPTETVNTSNVDTTTDLPADARADFFDLIQKFNDMVTSFGGPLGVAGLGSNGQLPLSVIPVIDINRGGTNATTPAGARSTLGLGNAATKDVNTANGVANLDSNKELKQKPSGAASANNDHVYYADGTWRAPIPATSGWVTQAMLKTASGSVSTTGKATLTLPGGKFGFYPQVRVASNGQVVNSCVISFDTTNDYRTRIGFDMQTGTGQARQEYIQSSPPYNLGDADVPLFIFLGFRDGELISTWEAQDPPWALNGPTDIHSGYRMLPIADFMDARKREAFIDALIQDRVEPVAEGMDLKNFDMPEIPTPFGADTKTVLIDPVGDECRRLYELQRRGVVIGDLVRAGALRIDNTPLKRCSPPGVDCVRAKWA